MIRKARQHVSRHRTRVPEGFTLEVAQRELAPPWTGSGLSRGLAECGLPGPALSRDELEQTQQELEHALEQVAELARARDELQEAVNRLTEKASTDVLTGLSNRRQFGEALEATFGLSRVQNSTLSLIMIDVDWFKDYNDTHGHPAGDLVLRIVAQQMLRSSRNYDVVARYGGEEFAILLPATDVAQAIECGTQAGCHRVLPLAAAPSHRELRRGDPRTDDLRAGGAPAGGGRRPLRGQAAGAKSSRPRRQHRDRVPTARFGAGGRRAGRSTPGRLDRDPQADPRRNPSPTVRNRANDAAE
jgi:GGDEF domain-containing protein